MCGMGRKLPDGVINEENPSAARRRGEIVADVGEICSRRGGSWLEPLQMEVFDA